MSNKIVTIPLAELVEDTDLYPRHAVDAAHVQALVFALESGANLPPLVADGKSKRLTDGWHRARALRRFLGPDAAVDVELVSYKDEAAMKFDAVVRNAAHGRRLDSIDKTRSVIMLRASGFNDAKISAALNMPEKRVEKLMVRVATAPKSSSTVVPGTNKVTLKRSVGHFDGRSMTKRQAEAHAMMPGTSFLLIAKQLCVGLAEGLVDLTDDRLVAQFRELHEELTTKLAAV